MRPPFCEMCWRRPVMNSRAGVCLLVQVVLDQYPEVRAPLRLYTIKALWQRVFHALVVQTPADFAVIKARSIACWRQLRARILYYLPRCLQTVQE